MKTAGIRANLAVSFVMALTVAIAPLGRADWVRVNPDGSVTRTQATSPAPTGNLAPLASAAQLQSPPAGTVQSQSTPKPSYYYGAPPVAVPSAPLTGSSCVAGYPSYPGYYPPAPGYYGSYVTPAPSFSMPIGRPTGAVSQPWITGFGGTTAYGYYAPPPAYPPVGYAPPGYPAAGYPCPPPAPVYGYPCAPTAYPAYPYATYPGAHGYGNTTSQGSFSFRSGGLSVTFGGSRSQTNTRTYNGSSSSYSSYTRNR